MLLKYLSHTVKPVLTDAYWVEDYNSQTGVFSSIPFLPVDDGQNFQDQKLDKYIEAGKEPPRFTPQLETRIESASIADDLATTLIPAVKALQNVPQNQQTPVEPAKTDEPTPNIEK